MRVSFTGTRQGYDDWQEEQLVSWLTRRRSTVTVAAHGCCTGADLQFHALLRKIFGRNVYIAVYPSTASTRGPIPADADYVAPPEPPLERNKMIVDVGCDQLLATPRLNREELRSGTWHAVRYAKKRHVPVEVFWRK